MATYDLTDSDTAKAFARIKRADADADLRLPLLISAMSRAVGRYTNRQWLGKVAAPGFDATATSTKTFAYDGSGYLSLAPFEAREVTAVQLNGVTLTPVPAGELFTGTVFAAEPRQKTAEDTYLYLVLPRDREFMTHSYYRHVDSREQVVQVTAKWGIIGVAADVELACLHAVADAYRNPEGVAQRTLGDGLSMVEDADDNGGSLPRASRALLMPLRRLH